MPIQRLPVRDAREVFLITEDLHSTIASRRRKTFERRLQARRKIAILPRITDERVVRKLLRGRHAHGTALLYIIEGPSQRTLPSAAQAPHDTRSLHVQGTGQHEIFSAVSVPGRKRSRGFASWEPRFLGIQEVT